MSFAQEWARSSEAARVRLASTGTGTGTGFGAGDLNVTPADKRAAARYIERELGPAAARGGDRAVTSSTSVFGSSNTTPGALRGWDTRKGLDFCLERWDEAWKNVLSHLQHEVSALGGTASLFEGEEAERVRSFTGSRLNDL
ncbi:hypothetical protein [Streptomyces sp. NPDC048172]|uniref:hypothetical protein n=1 Tax=Streptomyces sp. NPDC048172 TaxID=3365505 RepID=UPI0037208572